MKGGPALGRAWKVARRLLTGGVGLRVVEGSLGTRRDALGAFGEIGVFLGVDGVGCFLGAVGSFLGILFGQTRYLGFVMAFRSLQAHQRVLGPDPQTPAAPAVLRLWWGGSPQAVLLPLPAQAAAEQAGSYPPP